MCCEWNGRSPVQNSLADDADSHAFFWRAEVGRKRFIEGTDLLRYDEHGKIAEVWVMIRPLTSIAMFAAPIGPPLAARDSRARGMLIRLLTLALQGLLTVVDVVSSRLTGLG